MLVFSSLLAADFCLTGQSPVFVCITALLYIVLLSLSAVAFSTSRVRAGWDPGVEVPYRLWPVGSNTHFQTELLDAWLGWPDPISRLVMFCPNFD